MKFARRPTNASAMMLHECERGFTTGLMPTGMEPGGKPSDGISISPTSAAATTTPQGSSTRVLENTLHDPPPLKAPSTSSSTGEKKSSRRVIKIKRGQNVPVTVLMPAMGELETTDHNRRERRRRLLLHRRSQRLDREVNQENPNPDEGIAREVTGDLEQEDSQERPATFGSEPFASISMPSINAGGATPTTRRPMARRFRPSNLLIPDVSLSGDTSSGTYSAEDELFALGNHNRHPSVAFRPRTVAMPMMPSSFLN